MNICTTLPMCQIVLLFFLYRAIFELRDMKNSWNIPRVIIKRKGTLQRVFLQFLKLLLSSIKVWFMVGIKKHKIT